MEDAPHHQKSVNAIVHDFYHALAPRYHAIVTQTSPDLYREQFVGFSQDQLSGLAAYLFLPKADEERVLLFKQFASRKKDFEHTAVLALDNYLKHGAEIRMRYGLDWRNCLKEAERSKELSAKSITLLDMLATYLEMPQGDEHERFNMLLHKGLQMKLITGKEFSQIHDDIFDYLKPPPRIDLEFFKKTIQRMREVTIAKTQEEKMKPKMPIVAEKNPEVVEEPDPTPEAPPEVKETQKEAGTERKVNIWYERLVELSEEGTAEKQKNEKEEKKQEKKIAKPKQSVKQVTTKASIKEETTEESHQPSDEQKRRDLLGKLQSLGSFKI